MRPLDYGLSSTLLDETAESNLRLVASLMLYITRKASVPQGSAMMVNICNAICACEEHMRSTRQANYLVL